MGLPVPTNSPQITVAGRTYGVGAFNWVTPDGSNFVVGVFELKATGWDFVTSPNYLVNYLNDGEMLADVKAKGGRVAYLKWIIAGINAAFAKLFGGVVVPPIVSAEPMTDAQAIEQVATAFAGMHLTLINGVPVLA